MNMAWIRTVFLCSAVLLLSACASAPTEYLRLSAEGPPLATQGLSTSREILLVDHVQMPASIDRLYLTRGHGEQGMQVSGHVRWIAPLGGMAQRILAEDLRRQLPQTTVLLTGAPLPQRARSLQLRVEVQEFLPLSSGAVVLDADYFLLDAQQQLRYAGHFHYRAKADANPHSEAQTMSAGIAALAHDIAQHLAAAYRVPVH